MRGHIKKKEKNGDIVNILCVHLKEGRGRLLRSAVRCLRRLSPQSYLGVGFIQRGVRSTALTADPTIIISNNGIRRVVSIDQLVLSLWQLLCSEMDSQLQIWTHMTTSVVVCGFLGCLMVTGSGEIGVLLF